MHGLAVLQHDVVGDIHDVVDGPHAHGPQPLPHPLGGGADPHIAHHPGGIPGAEVRVRGLHVQQLRQIPGAAPSDRGSVEGQGLVKGGGGLPGQADDGQAVGPVGGDLKLHHVVIQTRYRPDVVPGPAVLPEDEDAVRDAVGELPLLRAEVRQGADALLFRVQGDGVVGVDVGQGGGDGVAGSAAVAAHRKAAVPKALHLGHKGGLDAAGDLVSRGHALGNGGLFRVNGLVVVQEGGGLDDGVGEVPLVQAQLAEGTEHPVGQHAPQLALFNPLAAGEGGLVQGHGHHVPHVDVPGPGDDLDRLVPAHVQLADPHVVRVRVALHGRDPARCHVGDLCAQVLRPLHLGAGEGHGLGEILVIGVNGDELVEPFSAQFHISQTSFYVVFFLFFSL